MAASTLDKELYHYMVQLNEPQKKSVLNMLKTFVGKEDDDNKMFGPISLEEYNNELKEAEDAYNKGRYITHEELEKRMLEW